VCGKNGIGWLLIQKSPAAVPLGVDLREAVKRIRANFDRVNGAEKLWHSGSAAAAAGVYLIFSSAPLRKVVVKYWREVRKNVLVRARTASDRVWGILVDLQLCFGEITYNVCSASFQEDQLLIQLWQFLRQALRIAD
jgi:hypothetical protein